jgi:AraC-like DNA-binding protein
MNIYLPTELLRPFVKRYIIIESEEQIVNRVFPDTSVVMAFRFKGKVSYEANRAHHDLNTTVLSGLRKSFRLINYNRKAGNVLVLFKETGSHLFINEPLHELFEQSISLDNLKGFQDLSRMEDQLADTDGNGERIKLVEQFLLSRLTDHKPDLLVAMALHRIQLSKGIIRMRDLAAELCISQDAFEKRFRRVVGTSPKQFSHIVRMRSVINGEFTEQTLAETAFSAGYFDQPHFNKDFKLFTGLTPAEFFKSPVFW